MPSPPQTDVPTKRSRITLDQEVLACDVSGRVFAGAMTQVTGVATLVSAGINPTSALDFIRDYRYLMEGRVFHRAMSARAMERFIQAIADTHGYAALGAAVNALDAHITYWEDHYGTKAGAMRKVADLFRAELASQESRKTLRQLESEFDEQVRRSLLDPSQARSKRLATAPSMPKSVQVTTTSFLRNPDVVATVLLRAAGRCEECFGAAPFSRKSDGSPYLEVHHRVRLADRGPDTVENAIALCPNCHRRSHFG